MHIERGPLDKSMAKSGKPHELCGITQERGHEEDACSDEKLGASERGHRRRDRITMGVLFFLLSVGR
jgi:hypothetical protein